MKSGICKLCLEYKHLCKKSHIIPKFLYKPLKGENNSLVFLSDKSADVRSSNGEYESDILCVGCDTGVIGKLDDYGAKFLLGEFEQKSNYKNEIIEGKECLVLENDHNYDYALFKLFLLSLLWRAGISSRPFFQSLKLSAETEENIRRMILSSNPGEPHEYPCFINLPPMTETPDGIKGFDTFFMPTTAPLSVELNDIHMTEMIILGSHYYFITSKPASWNVIPSIEKNKLTMGFMTVDQQLEIHNRIIHAMRSYRS